MAEFLLSVDNHCAQRSEPNVDLVDFSHSHFCLAFTGIVSWQFLNSTSLRLLRYSPAVRLFRVVTLNLTAFLFLVLSLFHTADFLHFHVNFHKTQSLYFTMSYKAGIIEGTVKAVCDCRRVLLIQKAISCFEFYVRRCCCCCCCCLPFISHDM